LRTNNQLKKAWKNYHKEVIPDAATDTQIENANQSFYAGAMAMFELINPDGIMRVAPQERVKYLSAINDEILAFLKDRMKDTTEE